LQSIGWKDGRARGQRYAARRRERKRFVQDDFATLWRCALTAEYENASTGVNLGGTRHICRHEECCWRKETCIAICSRLPDPGRSVVLISASTKCIPMFTALIHSSNPNSVVQVVIKHDCRYHARHSVANERKMMDATLGQT
jgi:hypothetical protein